MEWNGKPAISSHLVIKWLGNSRGSKQQHQSPIRTRPRTPRPIQSCGKRTRDYRMPVLQFSVYWTNGLIPRGLDLKSSSVTRMLHTHSTPHFTPYISVSSNHNPSIVIVSDVKGEADYAFSSLSSPSTSTSSTLVSRFKLVSRCKKLFSLTGLPAPPVLEPCGP